jgi:tetratricopeptide (TPR) repeat protein
VLETNKRALGEQHPDTLKSMINLASVLQDHNQYEAAEELFRRALDGREKVLGKEHPATLGSMGNLAAVLRDQGKYNAAEELYRQALYGREKVLGGEHPTILKSMNSLASVLRDQGKYSDAEEIYRRGLDGYEKVLGTEHPVTLTTVRDLATVLKDQGKDEAAEQMNRRADLQEDEEIGRGLRERTKVKHDDGLTEEQWLDAVDADDDTINDVVARKQARIAKCAAKKEARMRGDADLSNSPAASRASSPDRYQ